MFKSVDIESVVEKLHSNKQFFSIEVNPSLSAKIEDENIDKLKSFDNVDAFVVTDSPLARFKPSSILSSLKLQHILQKPIICTLSMRDRNSIALCGDILAINELEIRMFLTLTGDNLANSDCDNIKGVFENNSRKLAKIIDDLNKGIAINNKSLKTGVKPIYNFAVINAYSNNPQTLKDKIRKKISSNNISAIFTQPVYSKDRAEFLLSSIDGANKEYGRNTALVLGFFPVTSYKTAIFLKDKLPGVYIPDSWVNILYDASQKGIEEENKVGMELSYQLFNDLNKVHNKFHLMSKKPSIFKAILNSNIDSYASRNAAMAIV